MDVTFEGYVKLLHKQAHKCHTRMVALGMNYDYEDVFNEAVAVYCNCKQKFKPEMGNKFTTYLVYAVYNRINGLIDKEFKRGVPVVASIDAIDDNGNTLAEILPSSASVTTDIREQELEDHLNGKLSHLAMVVVSLITDPPDELVQEFDANRIKSQLAAEQGMDIRAPRCIGFNFVVNHFLARVLNLNAAECRAIRHEIKGEVNAFIRR